MKKREYILPVFFCTIILAGMVLTVPRSIVKIVGYDLLKVRSAEMGEFLGIKVQNVQFQDYASMYPFKSEITTTNGGVEDAEENQTQWSGYVKKYIKMVDYVENVFEEYATKRFPLKDYSQGINDAFNDRILYSNISLIDEDTLNDCFILNDNMLYYPTADADMSDLAESIQGLNTFCESNDIEFMYVQAPTKVEENETYDWPAGVKDYTNEKMNRLVDELGQRKIPCIDLRKEVQAKLADNGFYQLDPHWKAQTAFLSARVIAERLKASGLAINMELYDINNYQEIVLEDSFYGMKGRMAILQRTSPEDFSVLLPTFPTDMSMKSVDYCISNEGTFEECFVNWDNMEKYFENPKHYIQTAYSTYTMLNAPLIEIENHDTYALQCKILIISNSLGWSMTPYLGLGVTDIDAIYRKSFSGSIRRYIEDTEPDVVIVMYGSSELVNNTEGTHYNFFDFE